MSRPAASCIRSGRVDRATSFLDVNDLPFLIHHERGAVSHAGLGDENAVRSHHLAVEEIAQQGERSVEFGGEFFLGGSVVRANAQNLSIVAFKFRNTSLVCSDFLRSTTGKSGGEKCQHNGVFPSEARKRHLSALGRRQREVGRHVAFLQRGMWRLNVLGEERRPEQAGCERQ